MKKLLNVLLALAACSAALCVTASAAFQDEAPRLHWGQASEWDEGAWLLSDGGAENDPASIVIRLGDAPVVDAAAGLPLDPASIQEGDVLYAWTGMYGGLSQPPQAAAKVVVGNVPEDAAAPGFCQIAGAAVPGENGETSFPLLGGDTLTVTPETEYQPWLTRQIVRMEDLIPGAEVLVWKDAEGQAEKIILFAYAYQGFASWDAAAEGSVNGETVGAAGKVEQDPETGEDRIYLPLRAVAEAAGYSVTWDKNRGAVVYDANIDLVFFAAPGEQVIFRDSGETGISGPCLLEDGVTYLPAEDLCYWLNLFFVSE